MGDSLFPDAAQAADAPAAEKVAQKDELSFEEALSRLEALVRKMETGQLPLEKLMTAYEEGGKLAKVCRTRLDQLEQKVQILTGNAGNGPQWENFKG